MFKIGSCIVYEKRGVCEVMDICPYPNCPSQMANQLYYKLCPVFSKNEVIYVPTKNETFMRDVISSEEAKNYLKDFSHLEATIYHSKQKNDLTEHYEKMMEGHDLKNMLSLIKETYLKKSEADANNKKLNQIDQRFLKYAEDFTYGELAVALHSSPEQVKSYLCHEMSLSY